MTTIHQPGIVVRMTPRLTPAAEAALAELQNHQALVVLHTKKADAALAKLLQCVNFDSSSSVSLSPKNVPRCVKVWAHWLAENGPNTRQTITDATGLKFSERGTPHTFRWEDVIKVADDDDAIPADTIIRFVGPKNGERGASPTIYALWSQRYDVHPWFGVGPVRPDSPVAPPTMTGNPQPPDPDWTAPTGEVFPEAGLIPDAEVAAALSVPEKPGPSMTDEEAAAWLDETEAVLAQPVPEAALTGVVGPTDYNYTVGTAEEVAAARAAMPPETFVNVYGETITRGGSSKAAPLSDKAARMARDAEADDDDG